MTVQEYLEHVKLTMEHVELIADENEYWSSCLDFIIINWNRSTDHLSTNQYRWLDKIREDMTERRIEGKL